MNRQVVILWVAAAFGVAAATSCSSFPISGRILSGFLTDSEQAVSLDEFNFLHYQASESFSVALYSRDGNADLFVSLASETLYPKRDSAKFWSTKADSVDLIKINVAESELECFAIGVLGTDSLSGNQKVSYTLEFIPLKEALDETLTKAHPVDAAPSSTSSEFLSSFSALALSNQTFPNKCSNRGISPDKQLFLPYANATGTVYASGYKYYYFSAPPKSFVSIKLTSLSGNADLYVSSKTLYPTISDGDQGSVLSRSEDIYQAKSFNSSCFAIGVCGTTAKSIYTLKVDIVPLQSYCIAMNPEVANASNTLDYNFQWTDFSGTVLRREWRYFYLSADPETPLFMALQNRWGDADLYVSYASVNPHPNADTYLFKSTNRGSSIDYMSFSVTASNCYSIGVYGYSSSSFLLSIVDSSGTTPPPTYAPPTYVPPTLPSPTASFYSRCGQLYSGQSLEMYQDRLNKESLATYGSYKYYYFSASTDYSITITLTSKNGNVDLYVSNSESTFRPTKFTYEFSSNNYYSSTDSVSFTTTSEECIAIGVYGAGSGVSNTFTLEVEESYNYRYTSPPTDPDGNPVGLYIFFGVIIPIFCCCVGPMYLAYRSAPRPQAVEQVHEHFPVIQQHAVAAAPLLRDPEIEGEGEFEADEAGADLDNIPPPAYG